MQCTTITCVAKDPEGDDISHYWNTAAGSLGVGDISIPWIAPNVNGNYWITLKVSDGWAIALASLEIAVITQMSPHQLLGIHVPEMVKLMLGFPLFYSGGNTLTWIVTRVGMT
jgi:hypothetical protein